MKKIGLSLIMHFISPSAVLGQEKIQDGFMGIAIGMDVKNNSELVYFADNLYGGKVYKRRDQPLQHESIAIDSVHYLAMDGRITHIYLWMRLGETLKLIENFTEVYGKPVGERADNPHTAYLRREWSQHDKYRIIVLFSNLNKAGLSEEELKTRRGLGRVEFADMKAEEKIQSARRSYMQMCEVCEN